MRTKKDFLRNENGCINKDIAIENLKEIQKIKDEEIAHGLADDLLIEFIDDEDIKREWNKIDKWYA